MPKISQSQIYEFLKGIDRIKYALWRLDCRASRDTESATYLDATAEAMDMRDSLEGIRRGDKRRGIKRL